MRARIVLGCSDGLSNGEVAQRLRITGATVCKWRERFRVDRLEGLHNSVSAVSKIMAHTLTRGAELDDFIPVEGELEVLHPVRLQTKSAIPALCARTILVPAPMLSPALRKRTQIGTSHSAATTIRHLP